MEIPEFDPAALGGGLAGMAFTFMTRKWMIDPFFEGTTAFYKLMWGGLTYLSVFLAGYFIVLRVRNS